LLFGHEQSDS